MDNIFQTWEVPFDEGELTCQLPVPGPGASPQWRLQQVSSTLIADDQWECYFRRTNAQGGGCFIFALLNLPWVLRHAHEPYALRAALQDCLKKGKIGRVYFLDEKAQLRAQGVKARWQLMVYPSGIAQLQDVSRRSPKNQYSLSPTFFCWSCRDAAMIQTLELPDRTFELALPAPYQVQAFLRIPALELWNKIRGELDDARSAAYFALLMATLPSEERIEHILLYESGDGTQMREVLTWMMLALEPQLEQELQARSDVDFELAGEWGLQIDWRSPIHSHILHPTSLLDNQYPTPAFLNEAIERVLKWFAPRVNTQLCAHFLSAALIRQDPDIYEVKLFVDNPTAHERLEAVLSWREWLENH